MTHPRFVDLTGKTFARLSVLRVADEKRKQTCWVCRCECGSECVVVGSNLSSGNTKSCGCLKAERSRQRCTTHGKTGSRAHRIWRAMWARCRNLNAKNYGGRGISICDEWLSFELFLKDMGDPGSDQSIERKNNEGGYCKENCVWASPVAQARNRRSNRFLTFKSETLCVAQWSEKLGVSQGVILRRLALGWSVDEALTTSVRPQGKRR